MKNKLLPFILMTSFLIVGCQKQTSNSQEEDSFINSHPNGEKIIYRLPVSEKKDVEDYLIYTDDYFAKPANEFNISFSNTSLGVVEGTSPSIKEGDTDFSKKYESGEELASKLGFLDVDHDEGYENKPTADSVGAIFGHKTIRANNKDYCLILTAVRSINYKLEWVNQFQLGESGDHLGFKTASDKLLNEIKDYINKNNISGDIKLWLAGHSRGATIANMIGGQLDIDLINNVKTFGNSINYTKEDLYIQCFNSALATVNENNYDIHGEQFNNIQCFTNYDDIVSYIAPSSYSFRKYGKTYYLPSPITHLDYSSYYQIYEKYYREYTPFKDYFGEPTTSHITPRMYNGSSIYSSTKVDERKVNWTANILVKDLVDELFNKVIRNRANYVANYQSYLMKAISYVMDKYSSEELYSKNMMALITDIQANAFDSQEEASAFTSTITTAIQTIFNDNPDLLATAMNSGLSSLAAAHRSSTNRIWLKIMDSNYLNKPIQCDLNKFIKRVTIKDKENNDFDFNLSVFNQDNEEVAYFSNGFPPKGLNDKYTYGLYKNVCYIYLPNDGQYIMKITHPSSNREIHYSKEFFDNSQTRYKLVAQNDYSLVSEIEQTINL